MSLAMYGLGVVLIVVAVAPLAVGAVALRSKLVPAWTGAAARLAEVTIVLAVLLGVLHLLGAVGLYQRWAITAGSAAAGLLLALGAGRLTPVAAPEHGDRDDDPDHTYATWMLAGAGLLVAAVVAQWSAWVLQAVNRGITDYDSLTYHLPQAARFTQTGWITRLHFANPEFPNMFHPGDSELLHGMGMSMFERDILSPFANLGWLAVVLLAAWCVGQPFRAAPLSVAAVAAVLATPLMALQPGSALTDLASTALLLAAVALVLQPNGGRGALALGGAAAGMAIGVKLTALAPVAVLTVAVLVLVWRSGRWATWLWWIGPLAGTGAFWYVRNLVRGSSPVPSLPLGVGPLPFAEPSYEKLDDFGYSVLHYLFDTDVWRDFFLPGFDDGFGRAWPLLLVLAAAGLVLALVQGGPRQRVAAVTAVAALVAYAATPASAFGRDGEPAFFVTNLRYAFGGLVVAVALLPTARLLRRPPVQAALVAASAVVLALAMVADTQSLRGWPVANRRAGAAVGLAVAALVAGVLLARARRQRVDELWAAARRRPAALAVVGALVAGAFGIGSFAVFDRYLDRRYVGNQQLAWVDTVSPARIGFVGVDLGYPLYGVELDNDVQYVGDPGPHGEFHHIDNCRAWRAALAASRYEVVVHWRSAVYPDHVWEDWTRSDPSAREVFKAGDVTVYAITGRPNPDGC